MDLGHAEGVAGAVNGGNIVGVVNIGKHQSKSFLALTQDFLKPGQPLRGDGALRIVFRIHFYFLSL